MLRSSLLRQAHDRDYAWAVVNHELIVRKIPAEQPILRVPVREN
jgi:hypothetical protein